MKTNRSKRDKTLPKVTPLGQRPTPELFSQNVSPSTEKPKPKKAQKPTIDDLLINPKEPIIIVPKSSKKSKKRYDDNNNENLTPCEVITSDQTTELPKIEPPKQHATIVIVKDASKKPKKPRKQKSISESKSPTTKPKSSPKNKQKKKSVVRSVPFRATISTVPPVVHAPLLWTADDISKFYSRMNSNYSSISSRPSLDQDSLANGPVMNFNDINGIRNQWLGVDEMDLITIGSNSDKSARTKILSRNRLPMIMDYNYYSQLSDLAISEGTHQSLKIFHTANGVYEVEYHDTVAVGKSKIDEYALQIACKRMLDSWFIQPNNLYINTLENRLTSISKLFLPIQETYSFKPSFKKAVPRQLPTIRAKKINFQQLVIAHARPWLPIIDKNIFLNSVNLLQELLVKYGLQKSSFTLITRKNNEVNRGSLVHCCKFELKDFDGNKCCFYDFENVYGSSGQDAKNLCSFQVFTQLSNAEEQFKRLDIENGVPDKYKIFTTVNLEKVIEKLPTVAIDSVLKSVYLGENDIYEKGFHDLMAITGLKHSLEIRKEKTSFLADLIVESAPKTYHTGFGKTKEAASDVVALKFLRYVIKLAGQKS